MDTAHLMNRLAQDLDVVTGHNRALEFDSVEKFIRDIEEKYAAAFQRMNRPDLVLETRKRTSERLLVIATTRQLCNEKCCHLMDEVRRWGFSDLVSEVQCELIFARYLMAIGEHETARAIISPLVDKARATGADYAALVKACHELLDEL